MPSDIPNLNQQSTAAKRRGLCASAAPRGCPSATACLSENPCSCAKKKKKKTIFPRGVRGRERGLDQPFLPLPIPPHRRSVMMQTRRAPRTDGVLARDRGGGLNSGNRRRSGGGGCDDCRDDDDGGGGGGAGAARTGEG